MSKVKPWAPRSTGGLQSTWLAAPAEGAGDPFAFRDTGAAGGAASSTPASRLIEKIYLLVPSTKYS